MSINSELISWPHVFQLGLKLLTYKPITIEIIQKGEKTFTRYMYLDGFWQFFAIFSQKFLPLFKKFGSPKNQSINRFLKNIVFSQKSDNLSRFLVKFSS